MQKIKQDAKINRASNYSKLNPYYRNLLDRFVEVSIHRGLRSSTYEAVKSKCAGMLLFFQDKGLADLSMVAEEDVISYFCGSDGALRFSESTKSDIAMVFHAEIDEYASELIRIGSYLPVIKRHRKTIQYLTEEECTSIRKVLNETTGFLCYRDRAIGSLLYFTGMRATDIASLKFSNIDWVNEEIQIVQSKNGINLTLPLNASVGNAIYDYLTNERHARSNNHIFLSRDGKDVPINRRAVSRTANKIYKAAGIRMKKGERKGSHLFRHHVATTLAGNDVPFPVISAVLGHAEPESLGTYLSADFIHLRKCAISIERFPIREEVFDI